MSSPHEPTPEILAELRRFYQNSPEWAAAQIPALLDHIETLTAELTAASHAVTGVRRLRERADAAEAELAAERGRRETAESDLAQMTLARDELAAKLAQVRVALRELISSIDLRDRMVSVRAYKRAVEVLPEPEKP